MKEKTTAEKQIRILFLLSRFLDGGIDTVLTDYLRHLARNSSYRLTLAIGTAMGELEVFSKDIPDNVRVVHMVEADWLTRWRRRKIGHRLPFWAKCYDELCLSPIRRWLVGRELRRLAAQHDVVIDFDCCFYSFLKHIDIRKVAWYHFSFEQSMRQNVRRTRRIGRALESYDKVVCISEAMRAEGEKLFPQLKGKLCVVYNAKNREDILARAQETVDDERIRQRYILSVERLEESQKDITTLLKAYQLLRENYQHTEKLYLLGKGNSEQELRLLADRLGLSDSVEFLGFHANPFPWILHSSLLVHSAKFEGLPTILIEGLMLDKLMVATDCPTGPREILNDGKAGLLVPVGDAAALASSMHEALTDTATQQSLLRQVRSHRERFLFTHTEVLFKQLAEGLLQ